MRSQRSFSRKMGDSAAYETVKTGKLTKKKGTLKVTNRICCLERRENGPCLAYYDITSGGKKGVERGVLPLLGADVSSPPGGSPSPRFIVTVRAPGHKNDTCPISFSAPNAKDAQDWLDAIAGEVAHVRYVHTPLGLLWFNMPSFELPDELISAVFSLYRRR